MSQQPICVIVSRDTIERWANSVHVANHAMKELRARGAPINEGLFPVEIPRGRIVISEDDFGDLMVRWEP